MFWPPKSDTRYAVPNLRHFEDADAGRRIFNGVDEGSEHSVECDKAKTEYGFADVGESLANPVEGD